MSIKTKTIRTGEKEITMIVMEGAAMMNDIIATARKLSVTNKDVDCIKICDKDGEYMTDYFHSGRVSTCQEVKF